MWDRAAPRRVTLLRRAIGQNAEEAAAAYAEVAEGWKWGQPPQESFAAQRQQSDELGL